MCVIDRLFKFYDIHATCPDPLNEDVAWKVGYATALYFQRTRNSPLFPKIADDKTIVVGRDMRPTSPGLSAALVEGIRSAGANAVEIGMVDTPMVTFGVNYLDCVGGIQVTASHYPLPYNGFILSGPKGKPIASATGLDDIRRIASTLRVGRTGQSGTTRSADLWSAYRHHVLASLQLSRKIRVAVDASNAMAGWMVPAIFDQIPQLEIIPLLFETDGVFTHAPDPLQPENLHMLRQKVAATQADLGVCFDGDADCCVFVDEQANPIRPDVMTALMASHLLRGQPGATVVYDLRSSKVVPEAITRAGGKPHRERVGNVCMRKAIADADAIFGGELTGRYYFRDNFNADSGAIMFAKVLSLLASQTNRLSELVKPFQALAQSGELIFEIDDRDARIRDIADKYRKYQIDYLDGITVDGGDWWFNLRKSNSESKIRLNMEATTPQLLHEKLAELKPLLGKPA